MAGIILSRSKYGEKPYYIKNMSINIYSLEELCYYIYNNIYLIGVDLFEPGLISYIERELGESELAAQLEFLVRENAGLAEIIITILRYVDYYTEEEIQNLNEIIITLDSQNVMERLKLRADTFLNNKRFDSALRNYELIAFGRRDKTLSLSFYGNVWHNMGVAYGRLFLYKDAVICFRAAYEMNKNEESLKEAIIAECMLNGNVLSEEEDELTYVTCREIETNMDNALEAISYQPVKKALMLKDEGKVIEYHEAMENILSMWKQDYRNYMK